MTVSRAHKRGKPKMRPAGRNGRVRRNAAYKATTRPSLPVEDRPARVWTNKGGNDWAPDVRPADINDNVAELVLSHGRYEVADSIIRKSVLETEIAPRIINRSVTVIDDWIDAGVLDRPHIRVVEYARDLWRDIPRPRHPYFDGYDPEDRVDSYDAERAKNLLRRCRALVGRGRWYIFENVVRWNEPTGIPGSRIASVTEASIAGAQQIVRGVADEIRCII